MGGAASVGFAGGLGLRLREGQGLCFWVEIGTLGRERKSGCSRHTGTNGR